MSDLFQAQLLTPKLVGQGYSLVHACLAELTEARWQEFIRPFVADEETILEASPVPEKGAVVLLNPQGYMQGLFVYKVEADILHERCLNVKLPVAVCMFHREMILTLLADQIDQLAKRLKVSAIHSSVISDAATAPKPDVGSFAAVLQQRGFQVEVTEYCRRLFEEKAA